MNDKSHLLNAYYTGNVASWLKVQLDMDYAKGSSESHDSSVSEKKMKWKWVRALYRTMIYMQVNSLYLHLYWEVILIMVWNIAIRPMSRLIG